MRAMSGFRRDHATIIRILSKPGPREMALLRRTWAQRNNGISLESKIDGSFRGHYGDALLQLVRGPLLADVHNINRAIKGLGTKEDMLNDVLIGRSNADMQAIKQCYQQTFRKTMESDVQDDLSLKTKTMFQLIMRASRTEESYPYNYPSFNPPPKRGGLLTPWAEQGILMINTCLTVQAHEANSHANKGWEPFTQAVINTVVKVRSRGVVFLAWGAPAQKRCAKITGGKHLVLKCAHPSGLSAHKGFFGCGHFKKANDWLEERYGKEGIINWDLNVQTPIKAAGTSDSPVKATEDQKNVSEDGPATELPEAKNGKPTGEKDEFDEEEDEDAIEALQELAQSDAVEPPAESRVDKNEPEATTKEDAEKAVNGE